MNTITMRHINLPDVSEKDWQDLILMRDEQYREENPDDPMPTFQQQKIELSSINEWENHVQFWVVYQDEMPIGMFVAQYPKVDHPNYEANKNTLSCDVYICSDYRRRGIGTQILKKIAEIAQAFGATTLQCGTWLSAGYAFAEAMGATLGLVERISRVTMANIDWEMMQHWVEQGKARNPDVEICFYDSLPVEDDLAAFCQLMTDLEKEVPMDDLEDEEYTLTVEEIRRSAARDKERGNKRLGFYAKDTDGSLMGTTGTFHRANIDNLAYVGLTGVLPKYQGRGLGKYLKAMMTLYLHENMPKVEYCKTFNAESNAPMLHINVTMGFEPYKQLNVYKIPVEDVLKVKA